jgi:trehalose 6-phosphate synthase
MAIDPLPVDRASYRDGVAKHRLVVVSNRVTPAGGARPDSGGLAVAIRSALQESGGIWFRLERSGHRGATR